MMDIDRSAYGADTTTDEVVDGLDLSNLSVLITGASGGLGAETARALASKGASVVITARDLTKAAATVDAIKASTGNDDIEIEQLELGSLASIRGFGERWVDGHETGQDCQRAARGRAGPSPARLQRPSVCGASGNDHDRPLPTHAATGF